MYRLINRNAPAVAQALGRIGDLGEYLLLRTDLVSHGKAVAPPELQRAYRKYWRMNVARLAPSFYQQYFALLAEYQAAGSTDVERATRVISGPGGADYGLQFSFATKLVHMVDPRVPVFDSFVASFYFFTPPATDRPFEERLSALLSFHRFLTFEYARVLEHRLLAPAIKVLRSDRRLTASVPDERLIDWLLWAWVSLLRQGAQFRGEAMYD